MGNDVNKEKPNYSNSFKYKILEVWKNRKIAKVTKNIIKYFMKDNTLQRIILVSDFEERSQNNV